MLVEFTLPINGNRVYVNPANVNCVYGDKDSSVGTYIEMAGYSEDQALKVLGDCRAVGSAGCWRRLPICVC